MVVSCVYYTTNYGKLVRPALSHTHTHAHTVRVSLPHLPSRPEPRSPVLSELTSDEQGFASHHDCCCSTIPSSKQHSTQPTPFTPAQSSQHSSYHSLFWRHTATSSTAQSDSIRTHGQRAAHSTSHDPHTGQHMTPAGQPLGRKQCPNLCHC